MNHLHKSLVSSLGLILIVFATQALAFSRAFLDTDEFKSLSHEEKRAIQLILKHKEIRDFLELYPDWRAETYQDSDVDWHVDFYLGEEWIGYGHINVKNEELYDTNLPVDLSPEDFARGKEKIEVLVLNDPEMLARLGNLDEWSYDIQYDKYEQSWHMYFWRGIESIGVNFWEENGKFSITETFDPNALTKEETERRNRDTAINLAYSAPGIDEALNGFDNWASYAEPQGGSLWTVEFAATGKSLISVLVDIEAGEVLEAKVP